MKRLLAVLVLICLGLLVSETGLVHGQCAGPVVAWGDNNYGQCNVPAPNADFVAVGEGNYHSLGVKSDGTIVAWGRNAHGECDVPAPNADFVAVAGGHGHSLGLKSDGTIVAWGWCDDGQCDVPAPNADFVAVAGGFNHSLAIKPQGPTQVEPTTWGRLKSIFK